MRNESVLPLPVTAWKEFVSNSTWTVQEKKVYLYDNILVAHKLWDRGSLDWCHLREAHGRDGIKNPFGQTR